MKKKLTIYTLIIVQLVGLVLPFDALAQEASDSAQIESPNVSSSPTQSEVPFAEKSASNPGSGPSPSSQSPNLEESLGVPQDVILKDLTSVQDQAKSAQIRLRAYFRKLAKKTMKADEKVTVVVENAKLSDLEIDVFSPDGEKVAVDLEEIDNSDPVIVKIIPKFRFKPGRYRVKVSDAQGVVSTQDFNWGVLTMNTNKSIYAPGDTAKIAIAVLDETGEMVCDAQVKLDITDPAGNTTTHTTEASSIRVNEACTVKALTLEPDYEARYTVGAVGSYVATLEATTKNGTYSVSDSFEVREEVAFDIERATATRIYPPVTYPVSLTVTAQKDFIGEVTEYVPASFEISQLENHTAYGDVRIISSSDTVKNIEESSVFNLGLPFDGEHKISQRFGAEVEDKIMGKKYHDFGVIGHDGVDFDMPRGTKVLATDDGVVVRAQEDGDYGTTLVIEHPWGKSYYGHLSKMVVGAGSKVKKGQVIALSGNTGLSSAPHLHFGIKPNTNDAANGYYGKVNPMRHFGFSTLASAPAEDKQALFSKENKDSAILGVTTQDVPKVIQSEGSDSVQVLVWKVNMKKGETIKLGYSFKAPRVWPYLYLLGPLQFRNEDTVLVFQEARRWNIAADADGSGTNTVSPTSGTVSAADQTYTFTFTAAETMDSGGFTITVPSGWTAPQGTANVAGYTTAVGNSNATVATVIDAADSLTGWTEDDGDMCNTAELALDASIKQEGSNSISCDNSSSALTDAGDSFGFDFSAANWSSYSQIAAWVRSDDGTTAGDLQMAYDNNNTCASPLEEFNDPGLAADTWTYMKSTMTVSRTSVTTFCFNAGTDGLDNDKIWVDNLLIGPGVPTFSGSGPWTINVRLLDAANTETVTVVYGSTAGGASGDVVNSSSAGVHTFTTQSRTSSAGTLTNISSSPTVTLSAAGPTLDQTMRHGAWFSSGVSQPFTF